jgi:hypothetical protein
MRLNSSQSLKRLRLFNLCVPYVGFRQQKGKILHPLDRAIMTTNDAFLWDWGPIPKKGVTALQESQ